MFAALPGQEELLRELRRPTAIPDYVERDGRRSERTAYDDLDPCSRKYDSVSVCITDFCSLDLRRVNEDEIMVR